MKKTTFTLWHGFYPLISHVPPDRIKDHPLCKFRVAQDTMTQGACPAHVEDLELAKSLSEFHAMDGEPLEIVIHEIEV